MRVSYALNVNHDFFFKICELWFQIIWSLCVHMNYMYFAAVWDQWRHLIATQIKDKPEKLLKTCLCFWWKLKTNAKPHKIHKAKGTAKPQNQSLLAQKLKNQYQIAKKIPMPPSLLKNDLYLSLAFIHGGTTQLLDTVLKVTTWSSGAKKLSNGPAFYLGLLRDISNFHWEYFNFFTPPFFWTLYYFVMIWLLYFSKPYFFSNCVPTPKVFGKQNLPVGLELNNII